MRSPRIARARCCVRPERCVTSSAPPPGSSPASRWRSRRDEAVACGQAPSEMEKQAMTVDRMTVLSAMIDQGVIPVFYHPDAEVCIKVIQACANGGAKCIEFTNRGDFASHVFLDVARHFAKADPSVVMGVGSVVDAPTAGVFIANGAKFV